MVPACEKGLGGGHFLRAVLLVRELRKRGGEAFLYVKNREDAAGAAALIGEYEDSWFLHGRLPGAGDAGYTRWDFIVLDRFRTPPGEYRFWSALAPVIGVDEGGPLRDEFDFLVDLLPGPGGRSLPNIADPSLLFLPEKRKSAGEDISAKDRPRILVSFGAEDSAGLGEEVCRALLQTADIFDISVTSSRPAGAEVSENGQDAPIRRAALAPGLGNRLFEYDLLITHFGITAFEALAAGLSVILVSPGAYHEKLARAAGFYSAGVRGGGKIPALLREKTGEAYSVNRAFLAELRAGCEGLARRYGLAGRQNRTLADLLASVNPEIFRVCPVCAGSFTGGRGAAGKAVRFEERTYRRCPRCGLVLMNRLVPPPLEYERDYFFGSYKKQYGKTYLEDFPGLFLRGKQRLAIIRSLLPGLRSGALLDIGCAYGPFLAAAKEDGFNPSGLEPAAAAAWVRRELGVPVYEGFFPQNPPPAFLQNECFDAVTLWYVMEHLRNPGDALEEIRRILKNGGALAFSTPSASGISGLKSAKKFLEASPADHRTVWNPRACKRLMKRAGFTVKKIVITGHHPERFPLAGRFAAGERGLLRSALLFASRVFGLGDTFEVYAVKNDGGREEEPSRWVQGDMT
jgi:SAM-dependent methyltransferase/spore coat polysaccharide biosynthesis predicted glycosyltransferase SpsG